MGAQQAMAVVPAAIEEYPLGVEQQLLAWAGEVLDGTVTRAEQVSGGNRRRGLRIEVTGAGGATRQAFLRFALGLPAVSADLYTLWREADVYRALGNTGVLIPRIYAVHPQHQAMLVECVAGHADYARMNTAGRAQVAGEFAAALAALHAADTGGMTIAGQRAPATRAEALAAELAVWQAMYAETGRPEAVIAFALGWLNGHAVQSDAAPVVVHGDAGPGNFLIENDRLATLIDWELAHFGDPMEDLAWTAFRAAIQPFPDFAGFLAAYVAASGHPLDVAAMRYHRVFVATRILIVRHRDHGEFAAESDPGNSLISLMLNRVAVLEEIAGATGHALPPVTPLERPQEAETRMHDYVIAQLKSVVSVRSDDAAVQRASKSLVRITRFLREQAVLGSVTTAADRAELSAAFGPQADETTLLAAIAAPGGDDSRLLDLLWRRVARERQVAAPALGVMATRSYPPLS